MGLHPIQRRLISSSDASSQADLFDFPAASGTIVNVASVPQRSPFRYPGGKTWLVPSIRRWLKSLPRRPEVLLEPFAGGAIVGLTVVFEGLADRVVLVELDEQVAAVWETVLSNDSDWLVKRILSFQLTIDNVRRELDIEATSTKGRAFQTILKNRTYHGGILAPGSSLMKSGENGKGISSRWYPKTLAGRIEAIGHCRDKIEFIGGDGIEAIRKYASITRCAMFIDPPYSVAGKKAGIRLYKHSALDHDMLFSEASRVIGDVILTYDNDAQVLHLASRYGFVSRTISMKNTHHAQMTELILGRNLDWLDRYQ